MGFHEHAESFAGWPVADIDADTFEADRKKRFVPRLAVEYDDEYELVAQLNEFLGRPEAAAVSALVFGEWDGEMYQVGPAELVTALAEANERLPALRHLFIGDIIYQECMTSSMTQTNYGRLLAAYPRLETLRVRGSDGLSFGSPFRHGALRTLIVEDGSLREAVFDAIAGAELPALEHLELWLGVERYGGIADALPVRRLLAGLARFPKLRYLGLRNAELADAVVREVVASPVLERVRVLDLSLGELTDEGGEVLLASAAVRRLERLDLHHHFMSAEMEQRLLGLGIPVDVSDRQEADVDEWNGERHVYRYTAVSE